MPKSIKVSFLPPWNPSWNPFLKPAGPENTYTYIQGQFSARLGLATSSGPPVYMKLGLQQDRAKPNTGPDQCTLSSSPAYSLLRRLVASGNTPSCHISTTTSTCEKRCSGLLGGISETFLVGKFPSIPGPFGESLRQVRWINIRPLKGPRTSFGLSTTTPSTAGGSTARTLRIWAEPVGAGGEPVLFGPVFSNLTRVVSSGFSCLIEKSRQESTSRSDTRAHQRHSLKRAPNRTCSPTAPNSIPNRRPSRCATSEPAATTNRPSRPG